MNYPKPLMSITELVAMGYSRWDLKCYANAKGAPVIRTIGRGKSLFMTDKLDEFIMKMQKIN
jgi:hypothetical protein